MEVTRQNPTLPAPPSGVNPTPVSATEAPLKWQWQHYIDWCATGGLRVTEDGDLQQMTVTQLAAELQVNRTTLYEWPKIIPDFQARVAKRQREIYAAGGARANNIWKALQLKAMQGLPKQAEMVLSHFAGYIPPAQKVAQQQANSLTALLALAQQRASERARQPIQVEQPVIEAAPVEEGQVVTSS